MSKYKIKILGAKKPLGYVFIGSVLTFFFLSVSGYNGVRQCYQGLSDINHVLSQAIHSFNKQLQNVLGFSALGHRLFIAPSLIQLQSSKIGALLPFCR